MIDVDQALECDSENSEARTVIPPCPYSVLPTSSSFFSAASRSLLPGFFDFFGTIYYSSLFIV